MAHVQIRPNEHENGVEFLVDGHDIAPVVMHDGFSITATEGGRFLVAFHVLATAEFDLPAAVLQATQIEAVED